MAGHGPSARASAVECVLNMYHRREPCIFLLELSQISLKCSFLASRVLHFPLQARICLREPRIDTSDLLQNVSVP